MTGIIGSRGGLQPGPNTSKEHAVFFLLKMSATVGVNRVVSEKKCGTEGKHMEHSVADPAYHFDADPDPAYHFDMDPDPDPTVQFDADTSLRSIYKRR
jgi:hypothetical protein